MCVLITQSCLTLSDPMGCSPPGSSVHGILQAKILEWVAISFSNKLHEARDFCSVPSYLKCLEMCLSHIRHSINASWINRNNDSQHLMKAHLMSHFSECCYLIITTSLICWCRNWGRAVNTPTPHSSLAWNQSFQASVWCFCWRWSLCLVLWSFYGRTRNCLLASRYKIVII